MNKRLISILITATLVVIQSHAEKDAELKKSPAEWRKEAQKKIGKGVQTNWQVQFEL